MRSRSAVMLAIVVALAALVPGAKAGGEKGRSVTVRYERPHGLVFQNPAPGGGTIFAIFALNEVHTVVRPGERSLAVKIEDDSGQTVRGDVHLDFDRDGEIDVHKDICGETDSPLRVRRGTEVSVRVYGGQCHDGSPALATSGEVTLTFSSR